MILDHEHDTFYDIWTFNVTLMLTLLHFFQLVVKFFFLTGQVGDIHCQSAVGLLQLKDHENQMSLTARQQTSLPKATLTLTATFLNTDLMVFSDNHRCMYKKRKTLHSNLTELMVASFSPSSCLCLSIMSSISSSFMIFSFSKTEYCSSTMERASCSESAFVRLTSSREVSESLRREDKKGLLAFY